MTNRSKSRKTQKRKASAVRLSQRTEWTTMDDSAFERQADMAKKNFDRWGFPKDLTRK